MMSVVGLKYRSLGKAPLTNYTALFHLAFPSPHKAYSVQVIDYV